MDISENELEEFHRSIIDKTTSRMIVSPHLNPDWKIAFIGEPGDCKTISGVKLVLRDFMLHGIKCYSNMKIKFTVDIPDDNFWCMEAGVPGGKVVYESEPFNKIALFHFDERYRNSVIFIDEINIDMAEARRSSSNTNLNTNMVGQELRHLEAALIYTVINEMWVDNRIRDLTDIFIKTQDIALDKRGLIRKEVPGYNARWTIYPLSRKFCGESYRDNRETVTEPYLIKVRDMWDAFDTHEIQTAASGSLKYGSDMKNPNYYTGNLEVSRPEPFQESVNLDYLLTSVLAPFMAYTPPGGSVPKKHVWTMLENTLPIEVNHHIKSVAGDIIKNKLNFRDNWDRSAYISMEPETSPLE